MYVHTLMLGMVIPSITQLEIFLIDIIRNQDIKKLETTCFGLTLAIIKHVGDDSSTPMRVCIIV